MHEPENKPLNAPDHGLVTPSQGHPELGYETSDVNVRGVLVFLVSLSAFIVVFFVFVFGMGKVINTELVKHDGPPNKWNQATAAPHKMGKTMQSVTAMEQQQLATMTQRFPTPRLQMDDGNQDLADMHEREDLLLDHYTWVDKQQGVARIPIDRAMELIVERGLPVAPSAEGATPAAPMAEDGMDEAKKLTAPLTNGFARTTYEQELSIQDNIQPQRGSGSESSSNKPQARPGNAAQSGGVQ